jgi:hypothetical protein
MEPKMAVRAAKGTRVWIGPVVTDTEFNTLADFVAIEAGEWTELKEVENLGEVGDQSQEITFSSLADSRTRRSKGTRDGGVQQIVVGADPLDAGQLAFEAAEGTDFEYAIKIEHNNAPTPLYTNEIRYYRGLVMSKRVQIGENNQIVKKMFSVGVNSEQFEAPPALITPPGEGGGGGGGGD